jgi:hypothetical protein
MAGPCAVGTPKRRSRQRGAQFSGARVETDGFGVVRADQLEGADLFVIKPEFLRRREARPLQED